MDILSFFKKLSEKDSKRRNGGSRKAGDAAATHDVDAAAKSTPSVKKAAGRKAASAGKPHSVEAKRGREKSSGILPGLKLVKGKKKTEIKAEPIDEDALGFSFKPPTNKEERRNAVRIAVDGLAIRVDRVGLLPCINISATGAGFRFSKARFKHGVKLTLALEFQEKTVAEGIAARVVRHDGDAVGVEFLELDRRQEDAVSKLVLVGQKQQAARRNGS